MIKIENIFNDFPELESKRLKFIRISYEHVKDVFELYSNPNIVRYFSGADSSLFEKEEEANVMIVHWSKKMKDKNGIRWGLVDKDTNDFVGTIGLNRFFINHFGILGYDIKEKFWRVGYMSEAIPQIVKFSFEALNLYRVEADINPENIASQQLVEKCGFNKEGILKNRALWNDKPCDVVMYSLTRND